MFGTYGKMMYICSKIDGNMTNEDELLVKILKFSHEQVKAGKTYSQEEAELFLDQRLYEFRNSHQY